MYGLYRALSPKMESSRTGKQWCIPTTLKDLAWATRHIPAMSRLVAGIALHTCQLKLCHLTRATKQQALVDCRQRPSIQTTMADLNSKELCVKIRFLKTSRSGTLILIITVMRDRSGTNPILPVRQASCKPLSKREDSLKKKACLGRGHTARYKDPGRVVLVLAEMVTSQARSGLATTMAKTVMRKRTQTSLTMKAMTLRIWKLKKKTVNNKPSYFRNKFSSTLSKTQQKMIPHPNRKPTQSTKSQRIRLSKSRISQISSMIAPTCLRRGINRRPLRISRGTLIARVMTTMSHTTTPHPTTKCSRSSLR